MAMPYIIKTRCTAFLAFLLCLLFNRHSYFLLTTAVFSLSLCISTLKHFKWNVFWRVREKKRKIHCFSVEEYKRFFFGCLDICFLFLCISLYISSELCIVIIKTVCFFSSSLLTACGFEKEEEISGIGLYEAYTKWCAQDALPFRQWRVELHWEWERECRLVKYLTASKNTPIHSMDLLAAIIIRSSLLWYRLISLLCFRLLRSTL